MRYACFKSGPIRIDQDRSHRHMIRKTWILRPHLRNCLHNRRDSRRRCRYASFLSLMEMGEAQQVVALVRALPTVVHRQVQGEALAAPERLVKQAAPVEQPVRGGGVGSGSATGPSSSPGTTNRGPSEAKPQGSVSVSPP